MTFFAVQIEHIQPAKVPPRWSFVQKIYVYNANGSGQIIRLDCVATSFVVNDK